MKSFLSHVGQLFYWLVNWQCEPLPDYVSRKHVLIRFSHTSNMDTIRAIFGFKIVKRTGHIMIKKSGFSSRYRSVPKLPGDMPVDRDSARVAVGRMVKMFKDRDEFLLVSVPEGTSEGLATIKTGFWQIAKAADVRSSAGILTMRIK